MANDLIIPWDGTQGELGLEIQSNAACPISGSHDAVVVANRDRHGRPLRTVVSQETGLVFVDPRPDQETLLAFYRDHYRKNYKASATPKWKHTARAANIAKHRIEFIKQWVSKGSSILDIGASSGELLYLGTERGYQMQGVEPDPSYGEFGRRNYGVSIKTCPLQEYTAQDESFDLITMFHVLEHMENPTETFRQLAPYIKVGGKLMIEVPNVEDLDMSYSHKWHTGHLFHFNTASLAALGLECGLKPVEVWADPRLTLVYGIFERLPTFERQDWSETVSGNFQVVRDRLSQQANQTVMNQLPQKLKRLGRKIGRNVKEIVTGMTLGSRRKIVDSVSNKAA